MSDFDPTGSQQPPPGFHQPGAYEPWPGASQGYPPPATSGKAIGALVCGILGITSCGPFTAIPAIILAKMADTEIAASNGRLKGSDLAKGGRICGWIGLVLSVLVIIAYIIFFATFFATSSDFGGT